MKKGLLILILILIIIFGFLLGKYIYKLATIKNEFDMKIAEVENIEDECTAEYEYIEEIKQTNAKEEKISPNAKLITNIYYNTCGHTVKNVTNIENKYINLNEEQFAKEFSNWEVKEFSSEEITIYKEEKGICGEHYKVKDKEGLVAIYALDENENETLKKVTEIATQFLPLTDSEKLKGGILVCGKENLNSLLEDFE